ncbi:hypothetical protein [Ructibacterium gallinarum]|uniref:Uncharacterized protein n=1 Tax=Ructibacterium gallinarum TaxID=2779355 RepID=A0A9D5M2T1_9FIRM|nr:hypothetical protein [Ructibacterium gallinarum]MBE5039575.1 hypothetical protein [Ructibacterium gallinarum]
MKKRNLSLLILCVAVILFCFADLSVSAEESITPQALLSQKEEVLCETVPGNMTLPTNQSVKTLSGATTLSKIFSVNLNDDQECFQVRYEPNQNNPYMTHRFLETNDAAPTQTVSIQLYRPSETGSNDFWIDLFSDGTAADGATKSNLTRGFLKLDSYGNLVIYKNLIWNSVGASYDTSAGAYDSEAAISVPFSSDTWHTIKVQYIKADGTTNYYLDNDLIGIVETDYTSYTDDGVIYTCGYPKYFRLGCNGNHTSEISLYLGTVSVAGQKTVKKAVYSITDAVDTEGNKTQILNQYRASVVEDPTESGRGNVVQMWYSAAPAESSGAQTTAFADIEIPAYPDEQNNLRFLEFDLYKKDSFDLTFEFMNGSTYFYSVLQPPEWIRSYGAGGISTRWSDMVLWLTGGTRTENVVNGWGDNFGNAHFADNTWHNVKFEFDNVKKRILFYVDNRFVSSFNDTDDNLSQALKLRLRAPNPLMDTNSYMYIDNLKIGYLADDIPTSVKIVNADTGSDAPTFNAENDLAVKATIANSSGTAMDCMIIWAAYTSASEMIDVQRKEVSVEDGTTYQLDYDSAEAMTFTVPTNAEVIKAFIWLDDGQLTPLCDLSASNLSK